MINIPAFDLLRKFKEVDPETERLVLKKAHNRVTMDELISIFEKGVAGEYGKMYTADPQTLLGWIDKYCAKKNTAQNYLNTGLIPLNIKMSHHDYPLTDDDWRKEINKCYQAYLKGISHDYFHYLCYDQMMIDGKIVMNECKKHLKESTEDEIEIIKAKQKVISEKFRNAQLQNHTYIYFIQ